MTEDESPKEPGAAFLRPLMGVLACVAGAALVLMMVHVTADVVGRVVFDQPLDGTTEIVSAFYMVSVIFLPLAYVTRYEGHILVELFTRKLAPRRLAALEAVVGVVSTAVLLWLAWETVSAAIQSYEIREKWETGTDLIAIWPSKWLMPIGLGAMALYQIARIVVDARKALGRDDGGAAR